MIVVRCDNSQCSSESTIHNGEPPPTWIRIETYYIEAGSPNPRYACSWPCVAVIAQGQ